MASASGMMAHILPGSLRTGTLAFFCLEVELKHWLFLSLERPQPLDCNYIIESPGGPACQLTLQILGFASLPCGSAGKESACSAGDLGSIPGLGRSPGEGKDYPLQYSGLENSMDCIVHGVSKSWAQLSDFHFTSLHRLGQDQGGHGEIIKSER